MQNFIELFLVYNRDNIYKSNTEKMCKFINEKTKRIYDKLKTK